MDILDVITEGGKGEGYTFLYSVPNFGNDHFFVIQVEGSYAATINLLIP